MKPFEYFASLSEAEKIAYSERVGYSLSHLRIHVLKKKGWFTKQPSNDLIVQLVLNSDGNVSLEEAIQHFLVEPVLRLAAQKQGVALSIGKVEQGGDESLCEGNRVGL